ncbi:MAG: PQQ-binding-like beta-propeller repeat protein [Acidobacteriia bacterium]|nr:PQQ-binding-like beta-propeller repeat protein [Terriglobia bacterium]
MKTALLLALASIGLAADLPEWPQFGGPNRNFMVDATGLAPSWPADGPKKLWSRPLGEGYSAIAVDNGTLYTMYRTGENEVAIALDAANGKMRWEYSYPAPFLKGLAMENGAGPHATPLIIGDRVYTVGILAVLHAFDKHSGKLLWTKDLYKDFPGATVMGRGYSCSPLTYKNTIILTLGGHGHAVIALNPENGALVWAANDYANAPSSPVLIKVDGQDQLVTFLDDGDGSQKEGTIAGLDPNNGKLLWTHPHKTSWDLNIALPVWGDDGILLVSSAYGTGSRALQVTKTGVKELWASNRMRVHHSTMVRIGDYVYGSSGDFGPAPMMAVNVKTGDVKWQERVFPKANFIYAGGRFIVVDEDGGISLASFSPEGAKVISRASLLEHNAWTAPSLAGTKLYVRDRKSIVALELGN